VLQVSSKASSTTAIIRSTSSSLSMDFILGLLAHFFFLNEGLCRETFFFFDVSALVGGSFGSVTSPLSCFYPSSPPSSWFTLSPPPLAGELGLLSSKVLSSSSISIFYTSSFFFFFFTLVCPSCSTWVTKGLPMMSGLEISASLTGTRNSAGHSLVISSIYSSVIL
jgi:hypothetical protein